MITASKRTLIWLAIMVVLVALLSGCKTVTSNESYFEKQRMESMIEKMDSLITKSYVVEKDSSWHETIIKELQSIKEKSDTSHTLVVDSAGKVIKEKIIINNTKEVSSERDRQEIIGLRSSLEKLDSTVSVQNKQISRMDSLIRQSNKEKTVEKQLSWFEQVCIDYGKIMLGATLILLVVAVWWLVRKTRFFSYH